MNNNIKYWEQRYSDMSDERIVGRIDWSKEDYYKELNRWTSIIEPNIKQMKKEAIASDTVLDIGCGIGRWVPLLTKYFTNYYGCDITDNAIDKTQKSIENTGLNYKLAKVINDVLPFKNIKFDLIWTCVVLQHIVDNKLLEYYAQQMSNMTKERGYLLITENIANCKNSHYMMFRKEEVYVELFNSAGFELVRSSYIQEKERHSSMLFRRRD